MGAGLGRQPRRRAGENHGEAALRIAAREVVAVGIRGADAGAEKHCGDGELDFGFAGGPG
ncbi:MAG: hypothetical protein B9S34_10970 [Opitutia bacterium Tous-C1TDCM]|nr:MAG: hypothetical protein B9S34_10970 [Opitutae bacterium Tous-C1TDCM]